MRESETAGGNAVNRLVAERIEVRGLVQGVGFRPFVYRLAQGHGLTGWVANTVEGVRIEVEGERSRVERFAAALRAEAPPIARVEELRRARIEPAGHPRFEIRRSQGQPGKTTLVSPDLATCPDCLAELRDPADRRHRYPFINCTNCGPRFTIIRDVPYDRAATTMAAFTMCPSCRAEYENPLDRRFHAQPNACPACGPRVWLADRAGRELPPGVGRDPIREAGALLLAGKILAVKGLGGFHLAADAGNQAAVAELRKRKARQDKPFAVMVPDLESARALCELSPAAETALAGVERPIVLLPRRQDTPGLALAVAPFQDTYGLLLPYTPLHHLLLEAVGGRPLVMTSANRSDEPIEIDNDSALANLGDIADCFLLHDRPIHLRADDSVVRPVGEAILPVRRSRGYAPRPVRLRRSLPPVLAVGGQLKNTICLVRGQEAFLSQHLGDLERTDSFLYFLRTVEQLRKLLKVAPDRVAHDLHPDYLTTRWALKDSGLPAIAVQHHHAHVVAGMAEHGLEGRVLGVALDGTGYGPDGTIWGGEFLLADERGFQRVGHLPAWPLPGGELAIRQPWRTARSIFVKALGIEAAGKLPLWSRVEPRALAVVDRMLAQDLNCPMSSGCGRLFDAVAAALGLRLESLYEGQAAVELEALAARAGERSAPVYDFEITERAGGMLAPELAPMLAALARDIAAGVEPARVALGFHDWLVRLAAELAARLCGRHGVDRVVLSGGVFNNRYVSEHLARELERRGLRVFAHRQAPPGDGGISLGQAVVAGQHEL